MPPSRPLTTLGGRYALREPLGEGSFAVTYLAEDLVLGRLVAVKVLHARYGNDPAAAARFEREARAAAAVSSPYLVDVFDFGTDQGSSYIVLQYVAGPTLRQLIDRAGRLDPRDAVRIAVDILRGLAVIHEAGIIHRDVKPQNVLIDRNGAARVTDFGVALWAGLEHLTSQGLAVGTAVYMAPEQAHGSNVGPAADLYAVGVLLFEMLTGRPPFQADHPAALMLAHVRQSPPLPSEMLPGLALPVAVEREVMRALAKDPADRRASAGEMAQALDTAATGIGAGPVHAAGQPFQAGTTASVPALVNRMAALDAQATSVAPAVRRTPMVPGSAWLAPLALLVAAVIILGVIAVNGGFRGLAGMLAPVEDGNDPGLVIETATSESALETMPTATVDAAPISTIGPELAPTAPATTDRALFPIGPTGVPEQAPASADSAPTEPVAMTPTPAPPTEPAESIAVAPTSEPEAPTEVENAGDGGTAPEGMALNFGPGDWQGAPPADAAFGRPAVVLYGAESAASRAALQFELPAAPTGPMTLSVTGLGDETGMPFPYGLEVNGMYIGEPGRTFANWNPGQDGLNGEQAVWDQVLFRLPPEILYAGLNEIAIISLSPGDYDDRVPYLLLSDATLAPAE